MTPTKHTKETPPSLPIKGHAMAGMTNKTKNSLVKVVIREDDTGEWVTPHTLDQFYIDEDAHSPSIPFEITTTIAGPYEWHWEMLWDAHVSGLREKKRGRKIKTFIAKGHFTQTEKNWNAKAINKVIGGRLTVRVKAGQEKFKRTVYVLGKQPSQEKIAAYLSAHLSEEEMILLKKLIFQESKYKHFIELDAHPVVAGDKGFGLCQLTNPEPTYSQIWSWKENLDSAMSRLKQKRVLAKKWLDKEGQPYTKDILDTETIALWNGTRSPYHDWNAKTKTWERTSTIQCDTKTGNIGWDMTIEANQGKTEAELRQRDQDEYKKMHKGQGAEHPWKYTGICYVDHINKK